MFDLRQLRYFLVLAETLHFGRAAERLHISQPPLSRQISALEKAVGVQLLQRTSRAVSLTPAGRTFAQHAHEILAAVDLAVRSARASQQGLRGELRVSFTMCAAWNVLPRLLRHYRQHYPHVDVHLEEVMPRDLEQVLAQGSADLGISFPASHVSRLHYQRLLDEPLCAVLPAEHPLAQAPQIDASALADEDFISFPGTTAPSLHEAVIGHCRRHGFEPRIRLQTHLQQTIVNLVAEGLGVSLVPASMQRMQLPGAVFRPLTDAPRIEQGLFWSTHNDNPCLAGFLACATALMAAASACDPGVPGGV